MNDSQSSAMLTNLWDRVRALEAKSQPPAPVEAGKECKHSWVARCETCGKEQELKLSCPMCGTPDVVQPPTEKCAWCYEAFNPDAPEKCWCCSQAGRECEIPTHGCDPSPAEPEKAEEKLFEKLDEYYKAELAGSYHFTLMDILRALSRKGRGRDA